MKKTKEITVAFTQQIDGSYKPDNYLDFGNEKLPVHLTALVTVEVPEKKFTITESQLSDMMTRYCIFKKNGLSREAAKNKVMSIHYL